MDTIEEYLQQTKTAAQTLFEGIEKYLKIIDGFPVEEVGESADWRKAEKEFLYESFAMATLCGAVLQIAYMAIRQYSKSGSIPKRFSGQIKETSQVKKFCIGREKESVPIGLIIYAGRNQAMHYDDNGLRNPSKYIFEVLCTRTSCDGKEFKHPQFDLNNEKKISFADNITGLLGWRSYEAYLRDIQDLLR